MDWTEYDQVLKAIKNFDQNQFPKTEDRLLQRLGAAWSAANSNASPSYADFVNLLANVVRTRIAEPNAHPAETLVIGTLAITDEVLTACHFNILRRTGTKIDVKITKWNPNWLSTHADSSLIAPTLRRELRRPPETCSADPFLVSLGLKEYLSPALREAMRSVITAPAGATLLVNFPTGSGKSLLAHVPALLSQDGLSVVVVPTTALCIDQERALKGYDCQNRIEHETAFYGSSEKQRAIQNGIRNRIKNGTQRIVFTSPEMVCGQLLPTLWHTASAGKLEWLVIDEAHMVEHWGDSFRPKFQQLAGVRRGLLRQTTAKPFRTLLMSATMTAQTIDTLKSQFGEPGPFECIHSVRIRPEIASGVVKCDSKDSRMDKTIDAILNLPKPLIAYTTKVADSQAIHNKLTARGLKRIACFNGKTNDTTRESIIEDFNCLNIDIVVATSAFGMGIDAKVRSVVHSCIPESFDRYYQEIGRGGRDGEASISLVIYSDEDLQVAKKMSKDANIGMKKGLARWRSMHHQMKRVDGKPDLYAVFVNGGITPNQRNHQWDDHTLNLLASSGVISFDAIAPQKWDPNADPSIQEELKDRRIIRVHHNTPTDEDTWQTLVEPIRQKRENSSQIDFSLIMDFINKQECVKEIARRAYSVNNLTETIRVVATCGGCASCSTGDPFVLDTVGKLPVPKHPWKFTGPLSEPLLSIFPTGIPMVKAVFFPHTEWRNNLQGLADIVQWAIRAGIRFVVAEEKVLHSIDLPTNSDAVMTSQKWPSQEYIPAVPALRFIPEQFQFSDAFIENVKRSSTPQLLFIDQSTMDEVGRTLFELRQFEAVTDIEFREVYGIGTI